MSDRELWRMVFARLRIRIAAFFRKPLLLSETIHPDKADFRHANKLLQHVKGCRCSTCSLIADLRHELLPQLTSVESQPSLRAPRVFRGYPPRQR